MTAQERSAVRSLIANLDRLLSQSLDVATVHMPRKRAYRLAVKPDGITTKKGVKRNGKR